MGHICHHGIVVTAWNKERIAKAHAKAKEIFGVNVSEIVPSQINGYVSFLVAPDGSKEGWIDSQNGDDEREKFKHFLEHTRELYCDWIEYEHDVDNAFARLSASSSGIDGEVK